jgi:hypothetical protein
MGDIDQTFAADSVKVMGQDSTGKETYPVGSFPNLDQKVSDRLTSAENATLSVTTTPSILSLNQATRKTNGKFIFFIADGNGFYGYSALTCTIPFYKNQWVSLPVDESQLVYIKAAAGTISVEVVEGS